MLLKRILRRGKRLARDLADIPLRRRLAVSPRPARSAPPLTDLSERSTLVVTAHPDDESIAAAALMQRVPRLGVICITNGAPFNENYARQAGFDNRLDHALARRGEIEAALALLRRTIAPFHTLGISDQEASFHLVSVTRHLAKQMQDFQQVITHAYEGGHPDHDATAFCVHAAAVIMTRSGMTAPVIIEAPLYNAPNGTYVHQTFLSHPDAGEIVSMSLSTEQQDLKRRMFDCHATQKEVFKEFHTESEQFRLAPRYHFCAPPHPGDAGYDQFHWPLNSSVWRRQAWKAMRELGLQNELA
jgi:LmbE family N-acetylglucosaminyl deacetylase